MAFVPSLPLNRCGFKSTLKDYNLSSKTSTRTVVKPKQLKTIMTAKPSPTYKTAEYGTFSQSNSLPHCLLDNRVVIAGGGPAGLFTAISLHTLGVRQITVLERIQYNSPCDLQRSYVFGLSERGRKAMSKISGLLEHLLQSAPISKDYFRCEIDLTEAVPPAAMTMEMSKYGKNYTPATLFFRPTYMKSMFNFVQEHCSEVEIIDGVTIEDVTFSNDGGGISTIHYSRVGDAEKHCISTNALIACDGKNSPVVRALRLADQTIVRSPHGFEASYKKSRSSGKLARSLVVGRNIFDHIESVRKDLGTTCWTRARGVGCSMDILPMLEEDLQQYGGLSALISDEKDAPIWQLNSVEEAYCFFEKSFPALDVRKHISEDSLMSFILGRSVEFPFITLRPSMAAKVGDAGGVIIIGDASHAVPPDLGQGLNAAIEDVNVIAATAMEVGLHANFGDLAYQFHSNRIDDITSMAEMCSYVSFIGVSRLKRLENSIRSFLADTIPALFDQPFFFYLGLGYPYAQVKRRQRSTTYKIIFLLAVCAGVLIAILVQLAMIVVTFLS